MKKDTFYFSHDYTAANDVKCLFLRQNLGMEGYGIFWYLVEQLAQSGGILPMNIIPVLAMQMQVPEIKVKAVIKNFGLFILNSEGFFSERLNSHLNVRKTLSDKGREGALARWNKPKTDSHPNSHPINIPNSEPNAKEIKGKEIKVNNIEERKLKFASTLEPFLNTYGKEMIKEFYDYWTEPNKSNTKFKAEGEKTWGIERRLSTWAKNQIKFGGPTQSTPPQAAAPRRPFTG